jgi:hypothetical protein
MRQFLWKNKNMKVESGWSLKFIIRFMETAHEPLHLHIWRF